MKRLSLGLKNDYVCVEKHSVFLKSCHRGALLGWHKKKVYFSRAD